jgi:TonB family protein
MNSFTQLVQTPFARALGWTLMHFVWEGAAIALLLAITLFACRSASARLRYGFACAALTAMPLAFAVTLAFNWPDSPSLQSVAAPAPLLSAQRTMSAIIIAPRSMPAAVPIADRLSWLTPIWMFGVLVCYLLNAGNWLTAQRMRRVGSCAAPAEWQSRLNELAACMKLPRPVAMLESCLATVPVVIGYLRPVILLPIGMLTSLTTDQVEFLLIHELSHIRRHDYLVNLFQKAVEGLLFYHPAAWWISGRVRAERENCCDDVVLSMQGTAREYAETLATLEGFRNLKTAVAANGGDLVQRIRRILTRESSSPAPAWPTALLALGILAAISANSAVTPSRTRPPLAAAQSLEHAVPPPSVTALAPDVAQLKQAPADANPPQTQSAPAGPQLTELDKQIEQTESRLLELSKYLTPRHPRFIREAKMLEELRARRAGIVGQPPAPFVEQFWLRRDSDGAVLLAQANSPAPGATAAAGAIAGAVQDPSGGRIANCSVIVRNQGGQTVVSGSSDQTGAYRFESLPAGHYTLEFRAPGFKSLTRPADITAGGTATVGANLELGTISEVVTVSRSPAGSPATTPATANEPVRMGGNVQVARLLKQPKPVYPDELQQQGVQGTVKIQMIISKTGVPENLLVIPSNIDQRFVQAALDSVREWRYQPTLLNGMPVEVLTTVDVNFTLGN